MLLDPKTENRQELHYAAIRATVKQPEIPRVLPPLIPEILQWVQKKNLQQQGPVFFRYISGIAGNMEAEVGVPVSQPVQGDGRVIGSSFPAGKYVTAKHMGPYIELPKSHQDIEAYLKQQGLKEKGVKGKDGKLYGTRSEFYITHPEEVKDPAKWETEVVLMVE